MHCKELLLRKMQGRNLLLAVWTDFCMADRDVEQLAFLSISKLICFVYTERFPRREAKAET